MIRLTYIFWIMLLMPSVTIPYLHPIYDSDLQAIEIVNGTYFKAISQMLASGQSPDARYNRSLTTTNLPPDSLISELEHGKATVPTPQSIDPNIRTYDRSALAEMADLPYRVEVASAEPIIISKASLPTGLTYVTTFPAYKYTGVSSTPDHLYAILNYSLYQIDGDKQTLLISSQDTNKIGYTEVYCINGKIFLFSSLNGAVGEYVNGTIKELTQIPAALIAGVLYYKGDYYVSWIENYTVMFRNLNNQKSYGYTVNKEIGNIGLRSIAQNAINTSYYTFVLEDIDGKIGIKAYSKNRPIKYTATAKRRFDYAVGSGEGLGFYQYNLAHGITNYPREETPPNVGYVKGEVRQAYALIVITKQTQNSQTLNLFYSSDYIKYVNTGVSLSPYYDWYILYTHNYIYVYSKQGGIVVMKVDGYTMKVPRGRLAELFGKNRMLNGIVSIT